MSGRVVKYITISVLTAQIFYWESAAGMNTSALMVVGGSESGAVLSSLRMFTAYSFRLLAFNAAGDGPNSTDVTGVVTDQGGLWSLLYKVCV